MSYVRPLPLVADHAHVTGQPGDCALCPHGLHPGQRIARLATGEWCHIWCAAAVVASRSTPAS